MRRCNRCAGCCAVDCGLCRECQDKPAFGGKGIRKKLCRARRCHNPQSAKAAAAKAAAVSRTADLMKLMLSSRACCTQPSDREFAEPALPTATAVATTHAVGGSVTSSSHSSPTSAELLERARAQLMPLGSRGVPTNDANPPSFCALSASPSFRALSSPNCDFAVPTAGTPEARDTTSEALRVLAAFPQPEDEMEELLGELLSSLESDDLVSQPSLEFRSLAAGADLPREQQLRLFGAAAADRSAVLLRLQAVLHAMVSNLATSSAGGNDPAAVAAVLRIVTAAEVTLAAGSDLPVPPPLLPAPAAAMRADTALLGRLPALPRHESAPTPVLSPLPSPPEPPPPVSRRSLGLGVDRLGGAIGEIEAWGGIAMWWLLAAPVAWAGWLALASQSEVEALAGKPEVETALHAGILVASWCYHAATPGRSRKGLSLAVASLLVLCRAVVCCRVGDYSLLGVPFLNLALPRLVGSVLGHLSRRLERSSAVALPLPGGPTNSLIPSASPEAAAAMSAVALFDGVTGLAVAAATLLKGVAPVPGGGAEPPAWMHYFAFDTLGPRSMMVGYALWITYLVALARRLRIERFLHLWGQMCAFQPLAHCAIIAARSEPLLSAADFASFVSSPPARAGRLAIGAVTAAMPRALRWKLGCIAAFSFGVGLQDVARVWRFSIWPRPSLMLDRLGLPILGFAEEGIQSSGGDMCYPECPGYHTSRRNTLFSCLTECW
ncbi:hypothetical protein EMIHUDRAFT_244137 [Emiliania huxleyi CCMP1516]|uniref:CXXC-type domain-containing protein n=2 Tax=Emiliania huxleyi TaxID=2903 RepID=A0A0D3J1D3_EMIH1|nr:hypothetical protein EMIHUDRAFT_244137 [Emiliania huxleyi CCMP1516]EOD17318.1 hypothetical protein EMIHUDRAFT_244137 [Emiliania huxleyi CCMP1516]|eukprot:XP_005769747.1 hypothetical protein EMIHUDRAFT_244137 [Emiliania huxleyi CCMP1516]